ncbi:GTP-binding protein [Cupriavidus basilensis]
MVDVLIAQAEFADVIVVNKSDLISPDTLARLEAILRALNPRADIVTASFGKVAAERVLGTGRFEFEDTAERSRLAGAAAWRAPA